MYMVMIAKEGSTLVVKFCDPGTGFLVLGCGLIRHTVKMLFRSLLLFMDQCNDDQKRVFQNVHFMTPKVGIDQ